MAAELKIWGPSMLLALAALLVLAALPAAGARADVVTTAECEARGVWWGRRRLYPTDNVARVLAIDRCNLTEIDPDELKGLPKVYLIILDYNAIENINPAAFHSVPTLTTLWLEGTNLRELPIFDERSCPNLTELQLNRNKLTKIDNAETFSACTKLQRLNLDHNAIEFVHPKVFSALTDLKLLFLNYNKIRFIPDRMFDSNSKLELLNLNNNLITYLPPEFASGLHRAGATLKTFYFDDNPWDCMCLLELLADLQRVGMKVYTKFSYAPLYNGGLSQCNFTDTYPCRRDAPSDQLRLAPRAPWPPTS